MEHFNLKRHRSSFRDRAGFVFEFEGDIYRQINKTGQEDYEKFMGSGLYEKLLKEGLIIRHKELIETSKFGVDKNRYKIIQPELLPFVSYPYEWTFSQLKAASLLTLKVQKMALMHDMILKDASAFNIGFIGGKPVFIDTLSFWSYKTGDSWGGYKQFCEHFIATLSLSLYYGPEMIKLLKVYLNGIPLDLTSRLLPSRARLQKGLLEHIHIHSKVLSINQEKVNSARKDITVSPTDIHKLVNSLISTVENMRLKAPRIAHTEKSHPEIQEAILQWTKKASPRLRSVWDFSGEVLEISSDTPDAYIVNFESNPLTADVKFKKYVKSEKILTLVEDLTNPSPSLGWGHSERHSLEERGPADFVVAVGVLHELVMNNNMPFDSIAEYFSNIAKHLVIDFLPKDYLAVQRLLIGRPNSFEDYTIENFETAFSSFFDLSEKKSINSDGRTLYFFSKKA